MKRVTTILIMLLLCTAVAQAQIVIGGNVYGGGNKGNVNGNTKVTVKAGDLNKVFGGARMANVGGTTFVNIDGKHATDNMLISEVYGGNDVAGTIGRSGEATTIPEELENVLGEGETKTTHPLKNAIDNTWKTFVTTSRSTKEENSKTVEDKWILIGSLFGGGNGDFVYTDEFGDSLRDDQGNYIVNEVSRTTEGVTTTTTVAVSPTPFTMPDIDKTYLEIKGGNIAHVYGGGNKVTIRKNTTINIANESDDCDKFITAYAKTTGLSNEQIFGELKTKTNLSTFQSNITSYAFNHARIFGGNNKAEMAIRPTWNLQMGIIRDLYSGGNKGNMTSPDGLLLEINPVSTNPVPLKVENVYGGCRMADVKPSVNGVYTPTQNLPGYGFPNELSARVLIRGGDINNVYGGNDITGTVYGGNAIGVYTTIRGDIYGGGNGAYAYTNYENFKNHDIYGDFYYSQGDYASSMAALNAHRPNAEQVSVRLKGTDERHPTIIKGSIYVGGNCATMATIKENPLVELKIGSHVIADKVYLGNNGEKMADPTILQFYAKNVNDAGSIVESGGYQYNTLDLKDKSVFASYMEGVAMNLQPQIVFDNRTKGDPDDYVDNTSYVGSFFCGGNVGSMAIPGKNVYEINRRLNIFEKFVGGCNNADIPAGTYNAAYDGGVLGSSSERSSFTDGDGNIKNRLEINLANLTITPLRWNDEKTMLIWNTNKWDDNQKAFVNTLNSDVDEDTRLLGGNVYGGCYNSGHVNGNVVININEDVLKKDETFGEKANPSDRYPSGVLIENQRDDVKAVALSVFGAGYGEATEIWGSTTVNLNKGYAFQVYGGGEKGIVGKKKYDVNGIPVLENNKFVYEFNPAYSSTVNLNASAPIYSSDGTSESLAETEYLYGGGNEGDVCGNTYVNLGNGRVFDAFGGATDADILGHTEMYIGRQPNGSGGYKDGFPWIKDIVYGGNDFGGTIYGEYEEGFNYTSRIRNYATDGGSLHGKPTNLAPGLLKSASYIEYLQGRVDTIFGGNYGYYDYKAEEYAGVTIPYLKNSFVNIRPNTNGQNYISCIFGGGTGYPQNRDGDKSQDHSYVLIDIPDGVELFKATEVFGAGSYNGVGMGVGKDKLSNGTIALDEASAIIDLLHGQVSTAYGGSYNEGNTRRTVVNVPALSTIKIKDIFGGAYGTQILPPCDVYESNVNYLNTSENARLTGAIYGGNNNERRTLFTNVNISAPVWSDKDKGYLATVYGAGRGIDTWSEHTQVNLNMGAKVYNVYGGGEMGHVLNAESVQKYMQLYKDGPSPQISNQDSFWKALNDANTLWETDGEGNNVLNSDYADRWASDWKDAWTLGDYYSPDVTSWNTYAANAATNLSQFSDREEIDNEIAAELNGQKKFNTNVIINEGAYVEGYAYGGGLGNASEARSGDVYGTTYIAILGGIVNKDVYAAGRAGGLDNLFGAENFTASANAYIRGGMCRNIYGGGYEGHVGHHVGDITATFADDRLAEAHVVIGKKGSTSFTDGVPAILRNAYGGGEGGSVYGTSNITINNGYIGYRCNNIGTNDNPQYEYVAELDDQKPKDIELAGNVFGGGYVINSYVDYAHVNMYGGTVRGSLYGGGEVGPIGRGTMKSGSYTTGLQNGAARIFKAGKAQVNMYDGRVLRNVFGGGRGKDSWGGDGTKYMSSDLVATLDMKCKGYVFGQTEVNIFGGEVGTDEGVAQGLGNVFGGGDEGSVYSALEIDGNLRIGQKNGERYKDATQGYYYLHDGTNYIMNGSNYTFTEDCKVLVEPHCYTRAAMTIGGTQYQAGDYVPTTALNRLKDKTTDAAYWNNMDTEGIIIHNAVFAGGNIASGSSTIYANEKTVFGNATASIHDVYNRDLITIGTGHTGGLYGDGNLTFVDGYRELNITNYGTDYYHIDHDLTYDKYEVLPEREKAYYELKYKCLVACTDIEGTSYSLNSELPQDELLVLFTQADGTSVQVGGQNVIITVDGKRIPNPDIWQQNGVVSVYAGRIMNTIQRADLCGVFGSRMVMKGAQDRVPEEVDYTNYTINRVREVSLNKMDSKAGDTDSINKTHGNYFGIYSIVNYLGAITSDVRMDTVRTTNAKTEVYPELAANGMTFYQWKQEHKTDKTRNNGTCHNHLALASGVYLELTTEESIGNTLETKDWGPITGVVELDLINVQPGIGGGFVYAKNIHGVPKDMRQIRKTTTLTALNNGAATQWDYDYIETNSTLTGDAAAQVEWQTSGNFIHSSQTIIDDCYNISNRYLMSDRVPAHYWFISGSVYVYDQYISAYTGVPNAYSKSVEMPITINAASNGKMTLMDVRPNLYAYYSSYNNESSFTKLGADQKIVINNVTYALNSPISYWDWNKLSSAEKKLFVADTYVLKDSCYINNNYYPAGYVMLPAEYNSLSTHTDMHLVDGQNVPAVKKATKDANGAYTIRKDSNGDPVYAAFTDAFRPSNNLSHDNGYLLIYNVTNPTIWDKWYTKKDSPNGEKQQTDSVGYEFAPTYRLKENVEGGMLLGQRSYAVNDIIPQQVYTDYTNIDNSHKPSSGQATFVPAFVITKEYTTSGSHYYPGAPVSEAISGYTDSAYVCTSTIQLSSTEFLHSGDLMTKAEKTAYYNRFKDGTTAERLIAADINSLIVPAYYCTTAGLYGGDYYVKGHNYRALNAWSAMSENDRQYFDFNYDALDLLIDPAYGKKADGTQQSQGRKYQYDGQPYDFDIANATNDVKDGMIYSLARPISYAATYNGTTDATPHNGILLTNGAEYLSNQYEQLPNEQRHYAPIQVNAAGDYYVVKETFVHVEKPYAVGTTLSHEEYGNLTTAERAHVTTLTFTAEDVKSDGSGNTLPYYYCRESYQVNEKGEGASVTKVKGEGNSTYNNGDEVPVGLVISATDYSALPNYQKNFTIHGVSPMETSTLYVSRNSDINDLSTEKIITVVYKYDYEESDADGTHITPISERHVVNIHITFKSSMPTVPDIQEPAIVLPGTSLTMRTPVPTPGAYEILGGGWEIFETPSDAESHINGSPYTPTVDSLYWYQDGFYLAYYAKTYVGKTYSNAVPIHVANYHDLKQVMDDKKYHLHVDYDRSKLHRDSKIYINDYSSSNKNALDLLKDFYDLSLLTTTPTGKLEGHSLLNTNATNGVKAGHNLQFILRTDIDHSGSVWTPIGNDAGTCFNGTFHGDGHTISGLDHSFLGSLCGSVYNLGVTGSFTGGGVADSGDGYVESCWVKTSGTPASGVKAVFGNPTASGYEQVVNCYYPETNTYTSGKATPMSEQQFYNGTVAYNLNNFYLYKRYSDKQTNSGKEYKYYLRSDAGLSLPQTGYYASNPAFCSSGYANKLNYVEDRYADGDFRFAAGETTSYDERSYIDLTDENHPEKFYPIWPDDYLFYGQRLTYGYSTEPGETHQDLPTAIVKNGGRVEDSEQGNRVYRAPAYFQSKTMDAAHFNPKAYLAQKRLKAKAEYADTLAYPRMTAIDFAGHGDAAYALGNNGGAWFYPPLLDDGGLTGIANCDETQNLMVYAPAETAQSGYANKKTYEVLNAYFKEPAFATYYDNSRGYRIVGDATNEMSSIYGHLVQNDLKATNDHLLVDKQGFNAPFAYSFASAYCMWYQRTPEKQQYVNRQQGWQGISLPFTAELVTTHQKGEITHFYSGSEASKNGTGTKIGHEYWLREFRTGGHVSATNDSFYEANMTYPDAVSNSNSKRYTNTFLWDYYYSYGSVNPADESGPDKNDDTYQHYYQKQHTYPDYPLLASGTPYIIGLPGSTYYEFDLSGNFLAQNTKTSIDKLSQQIVTFASEAGATIGVSDDELSTTGSVTQDGYTFKASYMNKELTAYPETPVANQSYNVNYVLNKEGSSYDLVTATATNAVPFRPYFTGTIKAPSASRPVTRSIVFSGDKANMPRENDATKGAEQGNLMIHARKKSIVVESALRYVTDVRITTTSGITLATFTIQPGETIETRVNLAGVYIVQTVDGDYTKKLAVK